MPTIAHDHQANLDRIARDYGVSSTDSFVGDITEYVTRDREALDFNNFIAEGGRFTRIRLLTERGYPYMDCSYAYGILPDGTEVRLTDGVNDYKLGRRTYRSQIAAQIKAAGGTRAQQQQAWDTGVYAILWG